MIIMKCLQFFSNLIHTSNNNSRDLREIWQRGGDLTDKY